LLIYQEIVITITLSKAWLVKPFKLTFFFSNVLTKTTKPGTIGEIKHGFLRTAQGNNLDAPTDEHEIVGLPPQQTSRFSKPKNFEQTNKTK